MKPHDHLDRCRKSSTKIQYPFLIKKKDSQQSGCRGNIPHIIKATYGKLTANIIPSGKKLKLFLLKVVLEVVAISIRQEKNK